MNTFFASFCMNFVFCKLVCNLSNCIKILILFWIFLSRRHARPDINFKMVFQLFSYVLKILLNWNCVFILRIFIFRCAAVRGCFKSLYILITIPDDRKLSQNYLLIKIPLNKLPLFDIPWSVSYSFMTLSSSKWSNHEPYCHNKDHQNQW